MIAKLKRIYDDGIQCLGILKVLDDIYYTIECPWKNNEPFVSCVPVGKYKVKLGTFPKHGTKYEITGVPGRTAILFHVANSVKDIQGCVGLGTSTIFSGHNPIILNSRVSIQQFMDSLIGINAFDIEIVAPG